MQCPCLSDEEIAQSLPDPPDPDEPEDPQQVADSQEEEVVDREGDGRGGAALDKKVPEGCQIDGDPDGQLEEGGGLLDWRLRAESCDGEGHQKEQEGDEDPGAQDPAPGVEEREEL